MLQPRPSYLLPAAQPSSLSSTSSRAFVTMGKESRRRARRRLLDEILDDDDEGGPSQSGSFFDLGHARIFCIMMLSLLVFLLPVIDDVTFYGKRSEKKRHRRPFDEKIGNNLPKYLFRRVYRMSKVSFNKLHALLEPKLSEIFFPKGGGKRTPGKSSYLIDSKTRLSIAIRFFSGASPLDIMQTHDVGLLTVYYTVWGVIDAINETECLAMRFPSHDRQREIAKGFLAMSGAGFRKVIGAIDGLIIATIMPPLAICRWL